MGKASKTERFSMHFNKPTWEILSELADKQSKQQGFAITPAMYVRRIMDKHIKRKGL